MLDIHTKLILLWHTMCTPISKRFNQNRQFCLQELFWKINYSYIFCICLEFNILVKLQDKLSLISSLWFIFLFCFIAILLWTLSMPISHKLHGWAEKEQSSKSHANALEYWPIINCKISLYGDLSKKWKYCHCYFVV